MTLSMYDASIPAFIRGLTNLSAVLAKAAAHAEAKKIDPSVFMAARLAPDMLPLPKQIQIASDIVKGGAARLAGVEVPSFADTETTFPELQERIAKTIAFLNTIPAAQVNGTEEKTISLKVGGRDLQFSGQAYLLGFVVPNLYFHTTVAYAILRHNGVELGKMDFLGAPS
ncbi:MAG: DUF1993 domain-containing protein [Pseudomonadota bacterium]